MKAELLSVTKIWDAAPHNAFTDLIRFNGAWFCAFREASDHGQTRDGALRVLTSPDGKRWTSAARIERSGTDLRDPKLSITPDNRLMLGYCRWVGGVHQTFALFSDNGVEWDGEPAIGEPDVWLWRVTWHKQRAYGVGYGTRETDRYTRLYSSADGRKFTTVAAQLYTRNAPSEASLIFQPDDACLCLLRTEEPKSAVLGAARAPYTDWSWKELGRHVGGPYLLRLPDTAGALSGRLLASGRSEWGQTLLHELDPQTGTLHELLQLPSGGDASYPGLVWHDGVLWISYYSAHEKQLKDERWDTASKIYVAQVKLG